MKSSTSELGLISLSTPNHEDSLFQHTSFSDSCGKAAKDGGYKYFCIEFYGECWGYKNFDVQKPHAGAKQCWGKRPNYDTCIHEKKNPICVGTNNHGYIYEISRVSFIYFFFFFHIVA